MCYPDMKEYFSYDIVGNNYLSKPYINVFVFLKSMHPYTVMRVLTLIW